MRHTARRGESAVEISRLRFLRQHKKYIVEAKGYILLLALPLILCAVLFVCVLNVTTQQIERQGESAADSFQARGYAILREMQIVSSSLLDNAQFRSCINAASTDEFDQLELCRIIREHAQASAYVSNVNVFSSRLNHIYTEDGYYLYSVTPSGSSLPLLTRGGLYTYDRQPGWHVLNASYTPPYCTASVPTADGTGSDATLIVTLNMREFLRSLYNTDAALCCVFNDDVSFSTLVRNYPGLDWRSEEEVSRVLGQSVKCFYKEYDNFTYMVALSVKEYNAPLRTIGLVFCVYFLAVLVLAFFYLRGSSKKRYDTVAALIEGLPHMTGENATYEEMLAAVRTSLNEYRDSYDSERVRAQSLTLQAVLVGSLAGPPSEEVLREAGLPAAAAYGAVFFHIRDSRSLVPGAARSTDLDMTSLILQSALNSVAEGRFSASVTSIDRNFCAVLAFSSPDFTPEDARGPVQSTVALVEQEYGCTVSARVSGFSARAEDLPLLFQESRRLYEFSRAVDSSVPVLMQQDMSGDISVLLNGDFLKQLQVLSSTLLLGKYALIPQMTQAICSKYVSPHYPVASDRLTAVSGVLAEAVMSSGFPEEFVRDAVRRLRQADSVSALNALAAEIFETMQEKTPLLEDEGVLNRVCSYIEEHITRPDLSVPMICQACGVSVQRLTHLFRQRMNTSIIEYVNSCRIELAKKLLLDEKLTVASIAERTGYNNTVTFTRNFRRFVNITPTEYRSLNR